MKRHLTAVVLLVTGSALASAQSVAPSTDGLELLKTVAQRYADAKSYRIEAVEERKFEQELERQWSKTILKAAAAPGNRFRYEGRSGAGEALRVSDGKTLSTYHADDHRYTSVPVAQTPEKHGVIAMSEMALLRAEGLRSQLADIVKHLNSATRLGDQTITVKGQKVECSIVRTRSMDMKRPQPDVSMETTFWIEKAKGTILKTFEHGGTYIIADGFRRPIKEEITTVYTVDLDAANPDSMFAYVPPPGAKQVAEFPSPFSQTNSELIGQMMPALKLKSADGTLVSLESYRGKPVLLDIWATWCAPCVAGLPQLAKLRDETKDKGLVIVTVDQDEDAKTATDLLAKKGYSFTNFHDNGEMNKTLGDSIIPRTLLIDATGKVIYNRPGGGEGDLLAAISKLGPDYASLAPKPQPCQVESKVN